MSIKTSRSESAHGKTVNWVELHRHETTGEAWRQVHRALAMASEVAMLWGRPRPDFHHLAFSYCHSSRALVSGVIPGERDFRVGLRIQDPTLLLMGDARSVLQQFAMGRKPLFESRTWLLEHAEALAGEKARNEPLQQARFDPHPLSEGAPFGVDLEAGFREVDHAYGNADSVLRHVLAEVAPGTPIRVWPHHADIAALVELEGGGAEPQTVGLGLAPADERIAEVYERHGDSYFYAAPWPSPKADRLPELPDLPCGAWLREGHLLAALPLSEITRTAGARAQGELAERFLRGAYAACEQLF